MKNPNHCGPKTRGGTARDPRNPKKLQGTTGDLVRLTCGIFFRRSVPLADLRYFSFRRPGPQPTRELFVGHS
jgi:hypothetical protein